MSGSQAYHCATANRGDGQPCRNPLDRPTASHCFSCEALRSAQRRLHQAAHDLRLATHLVQVEPKRREPMFHEPCGIPECDHEERHRPVHHILKTWPEPFEAIYNGAKNFEIRVEDRDYKEGDWLTLQEWAPGTGEYTGRSVARVVTYIARGPAWKLPLGLCVMSLSPMIALDELGGTGPDLAAAIAMGQHMLDRIRELPGWPWEMREQPYVWGGTDSEPKIVFELKADDEKIEAFLLGTPCFIYELAQSLVSAAQEGLRRERLLVEDLRRLKVASDRMRAAIDSQDLKDRIAFAQSETLDPDDAELDKCGIYPNRHDGLREYIEEMYRAYRKLADEAAKVIAAAREPQDAPA